MGLFDGFKAEIAKRAGYTVANPTSQGDVGDIYISQSMKEQGIFKAYLPRFLYKPPFGYPRTDNVPLIKQLAKNPYILGIKKTIKEEVAYADWDIVFKEDSEKKEDTKLEELRLQIKKHFENPNRNKEGWSDIRLQLVEDILEVDAGVLVKVFNLKGEYTQLTCKDGGSFLVNPDVYGNIANRAEYINPLQHPYTNVWGVPASQESIKKYAMEMAENAAYFQYGSVAAASIPIPFGRREVVYIKQSPRSDQPYGVSPISILADIILNLVYGANYNLDFYMNNNMPEGIVSLIGAEEPEIKAFRQRIEKEFRVEDEATGFMRRIGYKVPIIPYDAKFTPFQLDPKIMQILEQQQWFYKIILACFGLNPNSMGVDGGEGLRTGDGDNQFKYYLRKSARPIMKKLKEHIDKEIIAEFGPEAYENLEYKWDEYDLDEDIKKHQLYKQQVDLGIKTPKMIAEENGIDYSEVEEYQEEKQQKEMELMQQQSPGQEGTDSQDQESDIPTEPKKPLPKKDDGEKSMPQTTEFEEELNKNFLEQSNKILKALDTLR